MKHKLILILITVFGICFLSDLKGQQTVSGVMTERCVNFCLRFWNGKLQGLKNGNHSGQWQWKLCIYR